MSVLAGLGRDLGEDEASCLRESLAGLDWDVFGGGDLDTEIAVGSDEHEQDAHQTRDGTYR